MSAHRPQKLLELWAQARLSVEMAIGQILQRLLNHEERLRAIEKQLGLPPQES